MKSTTLARCVFILLAFVNHIFGQRAELIFPSGHTDDVNTLDVDSSGTFLLSSSDDGTIKVWDIASGLAFKTYQGHEAKVYAACFDAEEGGTWENSAFMDALLSGLQSKKADGNGDGNIMVSELQQHLTEAVLKQTEGRQTPSFRTQNLSNDWCIYTYEK